MGWRCGPSDTKRARLSRRKLFNARENHSLLASQSVPVVVPAVIRRRRPNPLPASRRASGCPRERLPTNLETPVKTARRRRGQTRLAERENHRSVGRPPQSLGCAPVAPERWPRPDRQQRGRADEEASGDRPQELAVHPERYGGKAPNDGLNDLSLGPSQKPLEFSRVRSMGLDVGSARKFANVGSVRFVPTESRLRNNSWSGQPTVLPFFRLRRLCRHR